MRLLPNFLAICLATLLAACAAPTTTTPTTTASTPTATSMTPASGAATSAAANAAPVTIEEFMVPGADPGVQLYVRNKRLPSMRTFSPDNVVLFVHGATYPSETGFDLQLDGVSWMDVLARQGYDVYMLDVRGFGKSSRPAEMDQPAERNKPIVNSDTAARDYAAAADWVRARRGIAKLNVIGHSWGTVITGLYASRHTDKVQRLVLYAPVWLRQTASLTDQGGTLGAYRQVTATQARARKEAGLRPGIQLQSDAWFEAWSQAVFESDPVGRLATPKYVRAPNGSTDDGRNYWSKGIPLYDPALIKNPTLLILAEWDADTPTYMAQTLFPLMKNANPKKLSILSEGSHSIMNEVNRFSLFNEVARFLDDGRAR
jgi:pimeloyl-ACP methyl ester carboxylesterase